jgi:transketolase
MDAPRAANSGHPGTAMALAPLADVLFNRVMKHDPADPGWPDRDRFVLSAGHASILLYSFLHLSGYDVSLDDLRAFRQWGSRTPGHPEVHHTPGVEVTTGPLGAGFANAVGMAVAERFLRARFGSEVVDHHTFVVAGDGCLQEGVSHEAASLAGNLGLGRLVVVYDDNHITIDGDTALSSRDDAAKRFEAYGWHVERVGPADGSDRDAPVANDLDVLEAALRRAMAVDGRPSLVILRSHIGWPSPQFTDHHKAHGDPFPAEEIAATKALLGLPVDESFAVDEDAVAAYRAGVRARGASARAAWQARLAARLPVGSADRAAWDASWGRTPLAGFADALPTWPAGEKLATRVAVNKAINATAACVPGLVSGSADLTGNTGTLLDGAQVQSAAHPGGRQVHYGIREHAMGSAMNGMALHGGVLPVGGTFFVFSDYQRPAIRLAALSRARVVFVLTHDSVGLGEDGPTHQPIEHLAALRAMPGLQVVRPADANETAQAWLVAATHDGPTALVLSRQAVPVVTDGSAVHLGAGVVRDAAGGAPRLVLVGTGSEVAVCLDAAAKLEADGVATRVVSMPSWDRFAAAGRDARDTVLPPGVPRLAVEAAATFGWERWVDEAVGIDRFGASAPGATALAQLGIDVDNVVARAKTLLERTT